jgi:Fic family protein
VIVEDVLKLHRLFFQRIDPATAGRFRTRNVIITGTDYLPPNFDRVSSLIEKHLVRFQAKKSKEHPLIRAADLHAEFESIHLLMETAESAACC